MALIQMIRARICPQTASFTIIQELGQMSRKRFDILSKISVIGAAGVWLRQFHKTGLSRFRIAAIIKGVKPKAQGEALP